MNDPYHLAALLLSVAVFLAYLNHRFIHLQETIALMASALLLAAILMLLEISGIVHLQSDIAITLRQIDFNHLLLNGLLSFLLFAGALGIDRQAMRHNVSAITSLAGVATLLSTILVASVAYQGLPYFGIHLPLLWCWLFGALISPTDPIAVLAIFKKMGAPARLQVCVCGESLFNDGIAIVIFMTLLTILKANHTPSTGEVFRLFLEQSIGGMIYGALIASLAIRLMRSTNDLTMIIFLSLALVTGGYSLAQILDISGPLAMVIAGIMVGGDQHIQQTIHQGLHEFWTIIDELLNAVLFLILGLELLLIDYNRGLLLAILVAIPVILIIRSLTVWLSLYPLSCVQKKTYPVTLISWGGLRGGLAIALALSLPNGTNRDIILGLAYGIVAFSILVQGLSMPMLLKRLSK